MEKIDEFPTEKLTTIGPRFVNMIVALSKKYGLNLDNFTNAESQKDHAVNVYIFDCHLYSYSYDHSFLYIILSLIQK